MCAYLSNHACVGLGHGCAKTLQSADLQPPPPVFTAACVAIAAPTTVLSGSTVTRMRDFHEDEIYFTSIDAIFKRS